MFQRLIFVDQVREQKQQEELARRLEQQKLAAETDRRAARQREAEYAQQEAERVRQQQELHSADLERQAAAKREKERRDREINEASVETLHNFRELIRSRYELDIKIWDLRKCHKGDRDIVERYIQRASVKMDEIVAMVDAWEMNMEAKWTDAELAKVREIRRRIHDGGHRDWVARPPWNDVDDDEEDEEDSFDDFDEFDDDFND